MDSTKKNLHHVIKAFINKGDRYFIAECVDLPVVTQGKTIDETIENLKEALSLHLQDENFSELGFVPNPGLFISMELEPELKVA
jgi:predicted RNase H-like HicB family nuclease